MWNESFRKIFRVEQSPCINCEKKGCGSYHDKCPDYLKYKSESEQNKQLRKRGNVCREWVKDTTFKHRTNGQFRSHKK